MTPQRYRVAFTPDARAQLRLLDGAERLVGIPPGALSRPALQALLTGTVLGDLFTSLEAVASDPYGGPSLARTSDAEDDRTALLGTLAVTYMVSPSTQPPVITITGILPPKL